MQVAGIHAQSSSPRAMPTIESQFCESVLSFIAKGERIPVSVACHWCAYMYQHKRMGTSRKLLGDVCGVMFRPWLDLPAPCAWTAVEKLLDRWRRQVAQLRCVWYHNHSDIMRALWDFSREDADQALSCVQEAYRDMEMAYAALMLPPMGRCPANPREEEEDRRGKIERHRSGMDALPRYVWCIVASFCIDSVESVLAWRHAAGGDWGAALRCAARARWGGEGHLPTVERLALLAQGWESVVPLRRLGIQAVCHVGIRNQKGQWCPMVLVSYHASLNILVQRLQPRVQRFALSCTGWVGQHTERELDCDRLYVSLEDLGFPFAARVYTVRPLPI